MTKNNRLQNPYIICILATIACALWGSAYPCIKAGYELFQIADTGSKIVFAGTRFLLAGVQILIFATIIEKKNSEA